MKSIEDFEPTAKYGTVGYLVEILKQYDQALPLSFSTGSGITLDILSVYDNGKEWREKDPSAVFIDLGESQE